MEDYRVHPIGFISSDFKQKLGIPRQFGLVPSVKATIKFLPEYSREEAFRGLEGCSHLWIIFLFHKNTAEKKTLTVRPPRLGGNQRVGVFATRSSFHPNLIGQSIVKLEDFYFENGICCINISNHDLLEGTPVLDIKPYLSEYDALSESSRPDWMDLGDFNQSFSIEWNEGTEDQIDLQDKLLIEEILYQRPMVAYSSSKVHRIHIKNFDIHFEKRPEQCMRVIKIIKLN